MIEVLGVRPLEPVDHPRGVCHHRAGSPIVGVERPHRVRVDPLADLGGEIGLVAAQEVAQLLAVAGPARARAQRREPQLEIADPEPPQEPIEQDDQLRVDERRIGADRLGADLVELPEPPLLRPLVAEVGTLVPELHRLRQLVHPVLDVGAADRCRSLGSQRDRTPALVLEREHLLADDVGGLPHAPLEQPGVLEDRRLDPRVARRARVSQRSPRRPPTGRPRRRAGRRRSPSEPGVWLPSAVRPSVATLKVVGPAQRAIRTIPLSAAVTPIACARESRSARTIAASPTVNTGKREPSTETIESWPWSAANV